MLLQPKYIITNGEEIKSLRGVYLYYSAHIDCMGNSSDNTIKAIENIKSDDEQLKVSAVFNIKEDYSKLKTDGSRLWDIDFLLQHINDILHIKGYLDALDKIYINLESCTYDNSEHYLNLVEPSHLLQSIRTSPCTLYKKLRWLDYKGELFNPLKDEVEYRLAKYILEVLSSNFTNKVKEHIKELTPDQMISLIEEIKNEEV